MRPVLKARPDLNCVLHAHSKALAAYSAARKALPLGVLPRIEAEIGRIGTAPYRRPGSKALGQSIEQPFKKGCQCGDFAKPRRDGGRAKPKGCAG